MQKFHQRAALSLAAAVIAAGCGLIAGYLLGRAIVLKQVEGGLQQLAARVRSDTETASAESRAVLATLNASPYPYCSAQEIAWLRTLVFQSEYLKDAGRMRDGKIDCSVTLGSLQQPLGQFKPDFSRQDGTRVYLNPAPFRIGAQTVIAVQLEDSYIVYNPYSISSPESAPTHLTFTEVDDSSGQTVRLLGETPQVPASILATDGQARVEGSLYATRCATQHLTACVTAYVSIPDALRANSGEFRAYIVLGGISGAIFGLVCFFIYSRNKGIEGQLRRAVRWDEFKVLYQPIVELATGRFVGAEALVRWTDEEGFAIGPDIFIGIAEERGFVGEITQLVVNRALHDFKNTLQDRFDFRVNVNIAAADLSDPRFLPRLEHSLKLAEVQPRCLGIEITESYTARQQVAKNAILHLRQKGHIVHIDDFGTGYSSLAYLHDLEVDAIKIDQAFTGAIGTEAVTMAILPQILAMAAALKLQVIVEGIETEQQAAYFEASGRSILAQGWLFGRPVSAEAFHRMLASEQQRIPIPRQSPHNAGDVEAAMHGE
jgi:sensor c-di-GMP phosphodiesterase-like protein